MSGADVIYSAWHSTRHFFHTSVSWLWVVPDSTAR